MLEGLKIGDKHTLERKKNLRLSFYMLNAIFELLSEFAIYIKT